MGQIYDHLNFPRKVSSIALIQQVMRKLVVQALCEGCELYFEHYPAELGKCSVSSQADTIISGLVGTEPRFPKTSDFAVSREAGWLPLFMKTLLTEANGLLQIAREIQHNPKPNKIVHLAEY